MRRYGKRWREAMYQRQEKRLEKSERLRFKTAVRAAAEKEEQIEKAGGRLLFAAQLLKTSVFDFAKRYLSPYVNSFSYL